MKRIRLVALLATATTAVFASTLNMWSEANTAYLKGNFSKLSELSQSHPADELSGYLSASAYLAKEQPQSALAFVNTAQDSYFRSDLIHQLLNFYFNNQSWAQYTKLFHQLPDKQASINEICGDDTANFALNNQTPAKSDFNYLIANKMPLWCVSLIASKLNDGSLNKSIYLEPFLFSLIINDQTAQFNQLASTFHYAPVNFNAAIPSNKLNNTYQITYRISNLALRSPDSAYSELNATSLSGFYKTSLFNIVATNLAIKQMFDLSLNALTKANNDFVSDDQYEWRVRSYLAANDWNKVIETINAMPNKLQDKNAWLYWKAYADGQLGHTQAAQASLKKIPRDYNYYSLLAQAELRLTPDVAANPPLVKATELKYATAIANSFDYYKLGKQIGSSLLLRLATQNLYYIIAKSPDQDIATISNSALNLGWNEMSIYAANKISQKYAVLSFPILFSQQYLKYSQMNGIDMSYPMAITRQESRFNASALAYDGGVGLMQIMPDTASYIARKSGSSNCYKVYECNIKFGTWYLNRLYTQFGNNIIYATAGYNAGPGRAHRWQQTFHDLDNRIQIELIPFKITRDYVQKVITNKVVYDSRLDEHKPVNLLGYLNSINHNNSAFIVDDNNLMGDSSQPIAEAK